MSEARALHTVQPLGAAAMKYTGPNDAATFPSLIQSVSASGETGILTLRDGSLAKSAYFSDGRVVFASSNDPDDRLGELFLREGLITLRGFESCTGEVSRSKRRLGAILVEQGLITPRDLIEGVKEQVRDIVHSMFLWTRGDYFFYMGPLPTQEVITLRVDTWELIRSGIAGIRTWSRLKAAVGGLETRYRCSPGFADVVAGISLSREEERLLRFLGRPASVGELCDVMNVNNFELCRMLWAFRVMGLAVREADPLWPEDGAD